MDNLYIPVIPYAVLVNRPPTYSERRLLDNIYILKTSVQDFFKEWLNLIKDGEVNMNDVSLLHMYYFFADEWTKYHVGSLIKSAQHSFAWHVGRFFSTHPQILIIKISELVYWDVTYPHITKDPELLRSIQAGYMNKGQED